ncbi:MAG: hypothetical protein MJZ22_06090 [Candidatus Saccharibacteria bacterium]|nr:hypothetical protein [Candidatus Saccharibacteria bacterium]
MKNNQLYLSLSAAMLLMASCSREVLAENHNMCAGMAKATTSSFMVFGEEYFHSSHVKPSYDDRRY